MEAKGEGREVTHIVFVPDLVFAAVRDIFQVLVRDLVDRLHHELTLPGLWASFLFLSPVYTFLVHLTSGEHITGLKQGYAKPLNSFFFNDSKSPGIG